MIEFWKEKWFGEAPFWEFSSNSFAEEFDQNVVVAKKGWLVTILIGCGVGLGVTINQLKRKNCCFCSSWCIVWRWERGATNKRINGDEYQKFRNDILSDGGVFGYRLLIEKLPRRVSFGWPWCFQWGWGIAHIIFFNCHLCNKCGEIFIIGWDVRIIVMMKDRSISISLKVLWISKRDKSLNI
jgi:hypothetical protein